MRRQEDGPEALQSEQIIGMLREAEVAMAQGQTVGQVCRSSILDSGRVIFVEIDIEHHCSLETYQRTENSTYPSHIETLSLSSRA
jgi:hypothetical protein